MKKILTIAAATVAVSLIAAPANATLIDFVAEAAGDERGVDTTPFSSADFGGLTLSFDSSGSAYFDDVSSGRPGGLGACEDLNGDDQCAPSSDDNVSSGEWVRVNFEDGPFLVRRLSFNGTLDGIQHLSLDAIGSLGLTITTSTMLATTMSFLTATTFDFGLVDWIRFDFLEGQRGTEFYVASISDVPIPGALPLLLSGLAGLGFASRKKKKATA